MRASVVLTCYCWLLVPVSEPAHPFRRGASCSGPLDSPPESQLQRAELGTSSRMHQTPGGLLKPYLTWGLLALFLFPSPLRVCQKWGPGSPRPPSLSGTIWVLV